MNAIKPEVITLGNGYIVLLEPETLFWLLVEPRQRAMGEKRFQDLYQENIRRRLACDMTNLRKSSSIDILEIHTAEGCNMECSYCYLPPYRRRSRRTMTRQDIDLIISKFFRYIEDSNAGFKRIIFHGGEPCMVKEEIFEIIDTSYKNRHDVEFAIQTNGTLFSRSDVKFLIDRDVHVSYSLDGITPEANDLTRMFRNGMSAFAPVRQSIEWFRDYDWQGVIVTISKHNVRGLAEILGTFNEWGVSATLFNPVLPFSREAKELMPQTEDLIEEYKNLIDELIKINSGTEDRLVVDNVESIVMSLLSSNFRVMFCHMSPCGAGRLTWAVATDGTVYPDAEFIGIEEFALGNALVDSVETIVNSPALRQLRSRHVSTIGECKFCAFREICGANCPAAAYRMKGTLQAKSAYCGFIPEITKYIFEKISE